MLYNKDLLENIINGNTQVLKKHKCEQYYMRPDEQLRQVYCSEDKIRQCFPETLFVSNYGNLISLRGMKPRWLGSHTRYRVDLETGERIETAPGREYYTLAATKRNGLEKNLSISVAVIVALAFGSSISKQAKQRMDEMGIDAFRRGVGGVEVNHMRRFDYEKGRAYNYNPEYLQLILRQDNILLRDMPSIEDEQDKERFMERIAQKRSGGSGEIRVFYETLKKDPDGRMKRVIEQGYAEPGKDFLKQMKSKGLFITLNALPDGGFDITVD